MFVNGNKIFQFKVDLNIVIFPVQFCLGNICEEFYAAEFREVSFKRETYDFSVEYSAIDKSHLLNLNLLLFLTFNNKAK